MDPIMVLLSWVTVGGFVGVALAEKTNNKKLPCFLLGAVFGPVGWLILHAERSQLRTYSFIPQREQVKPPTTESDESATTQPSGPGFSLFDSLVKVGCGLCIILPPVWVLWVRLDAPPAPYQGSGSTMPSQSSASSGSAPTGYKQAGGNIYPGTKLYIGNPPTPYAIVVQYPADAKKRLRVTLLSTGEEALLDHSTALREDLWVESK